MKIVMRWIPDVNYWGADELIYSTKAEALFWSRLFIWLTERYM